MDNIRVWVITGVSSGLGLSLAHHVASQGDQVIGTVRSLSRFPDILREAGVKPLIVDFDKSDDEVHAAAEDALKIFGHVDVLVNNAGFGVLGPVEELKVSDIRAQYQTNLFGLIAFTQPFITHFRTRRTGHILNVSSIGSMKNGPSWAPYTSTKAALDVFTETLHQELKLFGVRVLSIMPGFFATSFLVNYAGRVETTPQKDPSASSLIYTDLETQGYGIATLLPQIQAADHQVGDPEKFAQRVFDVVTGTGLAKGLVARPTPDGKWEGPWEFNRVPLGSDCGIGLRERLDTLSRNVDAFEAVWKSTDFDEDQLKHFASGLRCEFYSQCANMC